MKRTLGREIHRRHALGQILQVLRRNSPVLVDYPGLDDGILDPGEQAHQLIEFWSIEPKLAVAGGIASSIDDRLDLISAIAIYQSPERDSLLQELPTITRLLDDLGVVERVGPWCRSNCV